MRARALRIVPRASIALALVPVVWLGAPAPPASAAVPTAPNPPIEDSCGLTATLVLDASGSIESSNAVADVRGAATAFLDSLRNTGSSARVTQFATVSAELAPSTLVDDASLAPGGDLRDALAGYYDPKPSSQFADLRRCADPSADLVLPLFSSSRRLPSVPDVLSHV